MSALSGPLRNLRKGIVAVSPCLLSATTRTTAATARFTGSEAGSLASRRSFLAGRKKKNMGSPSRSRRSCVSLPRTAVVPSALTCTEWTLSKAKEHPTSWTCAAFLVSRVSPTRHNCWRSTSTQRRSAPPGESHCPQWLLWPWQTELSHDVGGQGAGPDALLLGHIPGVSSGRTLA